MRLILHRGPLVASEYNYKRYYFSKNIFTVYLQFSLYQAEQIKLKNFLFVGVMDVGMIDVV
jgi:hypothetical protein